MKTKQDKVGWMVKLRILCVFIVLIVFSLIGFQFFKVGEYYPAITVFFMLIGGIMNFLAISFNGWKMPVLYYEDYIYHEHSPYHKKIVNKSNTKFYHLCDILILHFGMHPKTMFLSVGDILLFMGGILTVISLGVDLLNMGGVN